MAASHQSSDDVEAKIEATNAEIEAIEALEDEIKNADAIGDTRLSGLFHEARTTSKGHWKKVSAFCNIEDGEIVVDHLDKLSDGRWSPETRNRYDLVISVGIRPFMDSAEFRRAASDDLRQAEAGRANTVGNLETTLKRMEMDR